MGPSRRRTRVPTRADPLSDFTFNREIPLLPRVLNKHFRKKGRGGSPTSSSNTGAHLLSNERSNQTGEFCTDTSELYSVGQGTIGSKSKSKKMRKGAKNGKVKTVGLCISAMYPIQIIRATASTLAETCKRHAKKSLLQGRSLWRAV